jgi:hypothetical protein
MGTVVTKLSARSLTAAVLLSGSLAAGPALADAPAAVRHSSPALTDAALPSRTVAKRTARPTVAGPRHLVVADGADVVRARYATLVILGVGF